MSSKPKIKVELDKQLEQDLEKEVIKPRQHYGINKSTTISLPKHILQAITKTVADFPMKSIQKEAEMLNRYLKCRQAPAEDSNIKDKIKQIEQQIVENPEKFKLHVAPDENNEDAMKIFKEKKTQKIQHILRQRMYSWQPINYDDYKGLAYLFGRSPQEFAVILKVFREIQKRSPDFTPRSFFDFGSGVGTGTWAASELWRDSLYEYYLVDSSKHMNDLSDLILRDGDLNKNSNLRNVNYRQFLPAREVCNFNE